LLIVNRFLLWKCEVF